MIAVARGLSCSKAHRNWMGVSGKGPRRASGWRPPCSDTHVLRPDHSTTMDVQASPGEPVEGLSEQLSGAPYLVDGRWCLSHGGNCSAFT